jgi:hypothetical protein
MDSVLVTWEQLGLFFEFFGVKDWEPTTFLKNERFSQAESLLFYEFFSECLAVDEEDSVTLTFNLARLSPIRHRYEAIFLDLHRYEWTQRSQNINFFRTPKESQLFISQLVKLSILQRVVPLHAQTNLWIKKGQAGSVITILF